MSPTPPRLLITGASGYIGARLVELAAERGVELAVLGTAPPFGRIERAFAWRLAEQQPHPSTFDGVTAVIHLGHSWTSDSAQKTSVGNINLVGSEALARAAFAAGVPRFVFASTTSARPTALNSYGRIKHAIEERLMALPEAGQRLICARIGLVYGGPERGQYGLMSKLVQMTPILPMIGLDRKVQPIHLDEVCAGLLVLALDPIPRRNGRALGTYVLAGPEPVTFGNWLQILRRARVGKPMVILPAPMWAALLACDLTGLLPFVPRVDRERVLGLAGTEPMESAADLAALQLEIRDPVDRLSSRRQARRHNAAEAVAMLEYVSGRSKPGVEAVTHLIRAIERHDARPLGLPRLVLRCPTLLRAFEPLRPHSGHRLTDRLHLATMVTESTPRLRQCGRPTLLSLIGQGVLEAVALPFRLAFGGRYK